MNKKGISGEALLAIIILALSIAVMLLFLGRSKFSSLPNSQVCHDSVVLKTSAGGYAGGLNCKTDYVCISGGGKCANMNPTVTIPVDPSNKTQIMKAISDQLAQCWYTYGEGKLDYQGVYAHIVYGAGTQAVCAVCSIVGFDSTIQSKLSPQSLLADSSKFTSVQEWSDNYNKFSPLFDKYSKQYVPQGVSQNYFKALLVGIAQENNWGTGSDGGWIMGYKQGDSEYQTPDEQISTVAGILKTAFENPDAQIETQTGKVASDYSFCKNSDFQKQATCILSVYHSGQKPTGWVQGSSFLTSIWSFVRKNLVASYIAPQNTAGDAFSSDVMYYWNVLQEYFNQQSVQSTLSSTSQSQAPLTYQDLFYYMTTHSTTQDGQQQQYLSFLYGVSSLAQFAQGNSKISQFYNTGSIPLNGQYAIITGEGKQLAAFRNVLFIFTVVSPHVVPDFVPPMIVPTNKVSDYFGSVCNNNFITTAS